MAIRYVVAELGEDALCHEQVLVVEDLIAEDEVAEQTDVAVGEVEGLVN